MKQKDENKKQYFMICFFCVPENCSERAKALKARKNQKAPLELFPLQGKMVTVFEYYVFR